MKKLLFILCLPLIFFSIGCRHLEVDLPDGRKVTYTNVGFDTKIGVLDVKTQNGSELHLENLDGNSQALQVAGKALDLARGVSPIVP